MFQLLHQPLISFYDNSIYYPNFFLFILVPSIIIFFSVFVFILIIVLSRLAKLLSKTNVKKKAASARRVLISSLIVFLSIKRKAIKKFQSLNFIADKTKTTKLLEEEKNIFVAATLSIIFSTAVYLFIVSLVAKLYNPNLEKIIKYGVQISVAPQNLFAPEPVERLQYLIGILVFPLALFLFYILFERFIRKHRDKMVLIYPVTFITSLFLIGYLVYVDLKNVNYYYIANSYFYKFPINSLFIFLLFILLMFLKNKYESKFRYINTMLVFLTILLIFLVVISVFLPRVFDVNDFYSHAPNHLDAVFYSVSQVYSGKALLVNNFVNLYGLYPHFLSFIFNVIGLSVFNFTFIMTLLYVVSTLFILLFLKRFIKDKLIGLIGISFFFVFYSMSGGYPFLSSIPDPYFQFFPIRIFFPLLLIFLSSFYFQNKNMSLYYFSFVLYSLAILWNAETGIIVFLTWILSLFYLELLKFNSKNLKKIFKSIAFHIAKGLLILFMVFGIFGLYIFTRNGSFPDFGLFFEYQKFFYILGFNMTPMKLVHPWNIIILIYLIGLIYSFIGLNRRDNQYRSTVIFLLSVLGIGVFSRFQGRGTDVDLWGPIYSAVILVIIFTDELWSGVKKNGIKAYHAVVFFVILFFFMSSYITYWFENFDRIYKGNTKAFSYIAEELFSDKQKQSMISEDIKFIKGRTQKGEKIFILATFPGVYYAESKTISVLDTPGLMELFLKSDVEKIYKFLQTNKKYKVFTGRILHVGEYEIWSKEIEKILSDHYRKIDASKDDAIELYFPI